MTGRIPTSGSASCGHASSYAPSGAMFESLDAARSPARVTIGRYASHCTAAITKSFIRVSLRPASTSNLKRSSVCSRIECDCAMRLNAPSASAADRNQTPDISLMPRGFTAMQWSSHCALDATGAITPPSFDEMNGIPADCIIFKAPDGSS